MAAILKSPKRNANKRPETQRGYIPNKYGSRAGSENCPECGHDMVIETSERQQTVACVNCSFYYRLDQQPESDDGGKG